MSIFQLNCIVSILSQHLKHDNMIKTHGKIWNNLFILKTIWKSSRKYGPVSCWSVNFAFNLESGLHSICQKQKVTNRMSLILKLICRTPNETIVIEPLFCDTASYEASEKCQTDNFWTLWKQEEMELQVRGKQILHFPGYWQAKSWKILIVI